MLLGIGAVGAFLAVDLGAVAYANKWVGAGAALTRDKFIIAFQSVFGAHPGFRRNHAKGVAVVGYFDGNGNGRELSSAAVLGVGRSPVTGRFSLTGGNPFVVDAPGAARGLGLAIGFPGAQQWRTAMLNLPVFPDNSAQGFYDRLFASQVVAGTGKPDPAKMATFLAAHPETAAAMAVAKKHPPTPGFADSTFWGLNTFHLVVESGTRTPVRWSFVPRQAALATTTNGDDVLFDALVRQLKTTPLQWDLYFTVGTQDDPLDPTLPWPGDRRVIDAGTLTLTGVETEQAGNARDVNFDPLVLPDGIVPSDDPLLGARSAVYAASYRARTGEPKTPSAVQVDQVAP
ncbi:MAG: catalase [Mycobacterium sp.]|jgi:catalase|nr:catalase [Mycobacterium sp.]MDT5214842.1 catalase [Mycobacterium sp.]